MTRAVAVLAAVLLASPAASQPADTTDAARDPVADLAAWLGEQGVSLRQAFDGTSKEGKPAAVLYIDDAEGDERYLSVDLAVKLRQVQVHQSPAADLVVYPVFEWHRSDDDRAPVGLLSASARAEYRPVPLLVPGAEDLPGGSGWAVAPLLLASVGYTDDYENDEGTATATAYLSLTSNLTGAPGSDLRAPSGSFLGRYYPYLGYERYGAFGDEGSDVGVAVARLYVELWPASFAVPLGAPSGYLQLVGDVSYRRVVGGAVAGGDGLSYVSAGVNVFPDGRGAVGVGLTYKRGEDPSRLLRRVEVTTVGLKVKL